MRTGTLRVPIAAYSNKNGYWMDIGRGSGGMAADSAVAGGVLKTNWAMGQMVCSAGPASSRPPRSPLAVGRGWWIETAAKPQGEALECLQEGLKAGFHEVGLMCLYASDKSTTCPRRACSRSRFPSSDEILIGYRLAS